MHATLPAPDILFAIALRSALLGQGSARPSHATEALVRYGMALNPCLQGQPDPEIAAWVAGDPALLDLLTAPLRAADDLVGQLLWIRANWHHWLDDDLLRDLDGLAEQHQPRGGGPGPAAPPTVDRSAEPAQYSADSDWMADTVVIAKQTFVWLHQLSAASGRPLTRLDQIPDAALAALASRSFTALWLIGLWERSPASREIKRLRGNPEAESSAYALTDYAIAEVLGGQPALDTLRRQAWAHGLRLAADMVPNHTGLDSRWMAEHPDWFVQRDTPPFPGYRFTGPDLSSDPKRGLFLEDGYWDGSDAAVVFQTVDRATGRVRYVYHGNDGTQMPWNDTAQLDYLNPAVREAVIRTILAVARQFPILRFDAAMTLAREHIQRLWHPAPGSGGAIPSRSANPLSPNDFHAQIPREFWREVVERVRAEAPDTLLVAEAFWMMEGFFVRSLGMHRVYNSAFMHMLRDEDNAGYRRCLTEILTHSPAMLGRLVNFMNNPDEDTARAQFGAGDKYFAAATLLATMPGTPMFGHGQVEGFAEKYGMEFSRSYADEQPDAALVARHQREIVPLLRRRSLFSSATHFALFDFEADGALDPNVFAYANRGPDGASLVLVNNADTPTAGRLAGSVPQRGLVAALGLSPDATYRFTELQTGEMWQRSAAALANGLSVGLAAYGTRIFVDFQIVDEP